MLQLVLLLIVVIRPVEGHVDKVVHHLPHLVLST